MLCTSVVSRVCLLPCVGVTVINQVVQRDIYEDGKDGYSYISTRTFFLFQDLTAVKIVVFWVVSPCGLVGGYLFLQLHL
jgi:hypothetical protein